MLINSTKNLMQFFIYRILKRWPVELTDKERSELTGSDTCVSGTATELAAIASSGATGGMSN